MSLVPSLSVILPAFNEEENLDNAVTRAAEAVRSLVGDSYEIVVVDDGSSDGSAAVLERLAKSMGSHLRIVSHETNKGYGIALRSGFDAARGRYIFYTDADNQFDLKDLESVLPTMEDVDAVLGYRVGRQDGGFRLLVSNGYNALASLAFGMNVRDLNCSFKLFRREALTSLELEADHFFIDTEIVVQLHRAGYKYSQTPIKHYPREAGRSTVRPMDVPRTFFALMKLWVKLRLRGVSKAKLAARD